MEPMNEMKVWVSTSTNVERQKTNCQTSIQQVSSDNWNKQSTWLKTTDSNSELTGIINRYALNC